jgi:caffeoyl-CoA O-methyltransferase
MSLKSLSLTDELHAYLVAHCTPLDDVARDLAEETRALLPERADMQVAPEQAGFLNMLTKLVGARYAVEVGTFTGMSSLAIARGLAVDGKLFCFDISEEYTSIARRYWARAGVEDRIELHIGPAADMLRALPNEPFLDLVFIDADKTGYATYWHELVPRMRHGGVLAIDNVLWSGRVLNPSPDRPDDMAIAAFNDEILQDDRVEVVMLPLADGVTLARRI